MFFHIIFPDILCRFVVLAWMFELIVQLPGTSAFVDNPHEIIGCVASLVTEGRICQVRSVMFGKSESQWIYGRIRQMRPTLGHA